MGNSPDALHPNFRQQLDGLMAVCDLQLGSTFRSHDEQQQIRLQKPDLVATPGRSNHEHMLDDGTPAALAADISGNLACAHQNAARFGLTFPMDHEPWHIEPANLGELRTGRTATTDYAGGDIEFPDPEAYTLPKADVDPDPIGTNLKTFARVMGSPEAEDPLLGSMDAGWDGNSPFDEPDTQIPDLNTRRLPKQGGGLADAVR